MKSRTLETRLAHAGLGSDPKTGAVSTPIYQSATFSHPALGQSTGFDYSRTSNPTRFVLEKTLADLEGGAAAFAFSSGMAAITALLTLFRPKDKILVSDDLYGGTYRLFDKIFGEWGLIAEYADFSRPAEIRKKVESTTYAAFFIETPTNPLMKIADVRACADIAKKANALTIVDNTFMTPYCQRPLECGADVVVHSGTKFLGGHNDLLSGFLVAKEKSIAEKIGFVQNATGGILAPWESWLVLRGLKTLALRMDRSQENATRIAGWLKKKNKVVQCYFAGLPEHPGFHAHKRQASGPGALISLRVTNAALAKRIINRVKVITFAESLGGVESLITYPLTQTHADIPAPIRTRNGITGDLLRLSVGIENVDELIADLDQAIGYL